MSVSNEEFVTMWEESETFEDFLTISGMQEQAARARARTLRNALEKIGSSLKKFPRKRAARVLTPERIESLKQRIESVRLNLAG